MAKVVDFNEAEKKARKRDFDLENLQYALDHGGIPQDLIENAMNLLSKATGKELYIGTKRSPQSKVRFVQILQENLDYLYENDYLTGREKIFLFDVMRYVAFDSNSIVIDIKAKNPVPANISEISKLIKANRANTSTTINALIKKGLLAKTESGVEGNNAKAYSLFVNPHIMYAGDKDNVNEALKVMFHKAMKMPILKDLPNKLF
ncbi:MarR family transcriptional regulator [Bacillus thuringiensis]|nr:MarR family transcriptional regulator [Bacillus thuringiensis]MED1757272.1 MarR family transcriptional regulator [Bacillus thuringiensis]